MDQFSNTSTSDDAPKQSKGMVFLERTWKTPTLSEEEKTTLRSQAIARGMSLAQKGAPNKGLWSFSHIHAKALTLGVFGVVVLGGGVSFAAEKALPGEIMYPVKTIFNDSIIELVALTNAADMEAKVTIIERRGDEIEALVQSHTLTDEAVETITDNIEHHVQEALQAERTPESIDILTDDLSQALEESVELLESAEDSVREAEGADSATAFSTATTTQATSTSILIAHLDQTPAETNILEALDDAQASIETLNDSLEAVDAQ